jgi:hypothetical protein
MQDQLETAWQVVLEKTKLKFQSAITQEAILDSIAFDVYIDHTLDAVIMEFTRYITSETIEEISYPTTWWDAVKERFFPKTALKKFPVKYTRITAKALYPKISLPREDHVIKFQIMKRVEG